MSSISNRKPESLTNPIFKAAGRPSTIPVLGGVVSGGLLAMAIIQTVVSGIIGIISLLYALIKSNSGSATKIAQTAFELAKQGANEIGPQFLNTISLGMLGFCVRHVKC